MFITDMGKQQRNGFNLSLATGIPVEVPSKFIGGDAEGMSGVRRRGHRRTAARTVDVLSPEVQCGIDP